MTDYESIAQDIKIIFDMLIYSLETSKEMKAKTWENLVNTYCLLIKNETDLNDTNDAKKIASLLLDIKVICKNQKEIDEINDKKTALNKLLDELNIKSMC